MFGLEYLINEAFYVKDASGNGVDEGIYIWESIIEQHVLPALKHTIGYCCYIYTNINIYNTTKFLLKYTPMGVYFYKVLQSIYIASRDKTRIKRMQVEDIQLQVQIVEAKMTVREAEMCEREGVVRECGARLRRARARVRRLVAGDEALRRAVHADDVTQPFEYDSITELLKEMKCDPTAFCDKEKEVLDSGEHAPTNADPAAGAQENGACTTFEEGDNKDCRVHIVKVTNVYKVAYLKHYIKQKKLRKANRQAILKKKIEHIRKLLEDWQNTLNMVINYSKISMLDHASHSMDFTSQEAMGDSKQNVREFTDSESDIKTGTDPSLCDEYSLSWPHHHRKQMYNYENPESVVCNDYYEPLDYEMPCRAQCECNGPKSGNVLLLLPEETSSQLALEERSDAGDHERDLIEL